LSLFKFEEILTPNRKAISTQQTGTQFQEQRTELHAVDGIVTFTSPITFVEIYNRDDMHDGTFIVNGLTIVVPSEETFFADVGGTLSNIVQVTGSTQYIISRYL